MPARSRAAAERSLRAIPLTWRSWIWPQTTPSTHALHSAHALHRYRRGTRDTPLADPLARGLASRGWSALAPVAAVPARPPRGAPLDGVERGPDARGRPPGSRLGGGSPLRHTRVLPPAGRPAQDPAGSRLRHRPPPRP